MARVLFVKRSENVKTGAIATSYTNPNTCPTSCPLRGNACYASAGFHTRMAWGRTEGNGNQANVYDWAAFCKQVAALPVGALFRHNIAGDLPGIGERINISMLKLLCAAREMSHAIAWTYTHKPVFTSTNPDETIVAANRTTIAEANAQGFTVNLSADNMAEADAMHTLRIAPVVVTVPEDTPAHGKTPAGTTYVVCPAQTRAGVTCASCGGGRPFCSKSDRSFIVAFRAHGTKKNALNERLTS